MSSKSIRNRDAIVRHAQRERVAGIPGFGMAFCFAITKALVEPVPLQTHEMVFDTLRAPTPPDYCPLCACPAVAPCRDPNGDWTWSCAGGCNP